MKIEHGNWRVRRNCCITGFCAECHEKGPLGKPQARTIQADGYSEKYARWIAANWSDYNAFAEPMPGSATQENG